MGPLKSPQNPKTPKPQNPEGEICEDFCSYVNYSYVYISADILEIHCFEIPHNLTEVGSLVWIVVPASSHQIEEWPWCISLRNLWPQTLLYHSLTDNLSIYTIVGW